MLEVLVFFFLNHRIKVFFLFSGSGGFIRLLVVQPLKKSFLYDCLLLASSNYKKRMFRQNRYLWTRWSGRPQQLPQPPAPPPVNHAVLRQICMIRKHDNKKTLRTCPLRIQICIIFLLSNYGRIKQEEGFGWTS